MHYKPFLIIISAPSGGGKTAITSAVLHQNSDIAYSVSATTRPRRENEINGIDYYFITTQEFKDKVQRKEFIEWAIVHNHYYGTPVEYIEKELKNRCIMLDIDIQGARLAKKLYPDSVSIFILPPSFEVLENRLRKRGTDSEIVIQQRLAEARREILAIKEYDYAVINEDLKCSIQMVESIIYAERMKINRSGNIPIFKMN